MSVSRAALEIILRAKDEASGVIKSVEGTLGSLASGGLKLAAGAVATLSGVAVGAGVALFGLATGAAPIEGIGAAFRAVAGDAEGTLAILRDGSLGMVSDAALMRNYNQAVQLVGKSFADDLPNAMQYLSKVSASTGKDMGFLMDSLTTGVGRLSPMILDNLGIQVDLVAANEAYATSIGKTVGELTKEEQQAALMAQVLGKLEENTASLPDITDNATTAMAQLQTTFQNVKDQVGVALIPVLKELLTPLGELAVQYGPMLVQWLISLIPAIQEAVAWFMQIATNVDGMSTGVSEALQRMQPIFDEVWGFILAISADAVAWFQANLPLIQANGQALADFWTNHIVPALDNSWNMIKTFISTGMELIQGVITTVMQMITGDWEGAWTTIKETVGVIWEGIKTVVTEFITGVVEAVGSNMTEFKATWQNNWEMAKQIVTTIWENIKTAISDKITGIIADVRGWLGDVKAAIQGFNLADAGRALIEGMADGIRGAAQGLINAARGVVQNAIDAAKALLGIHSPSKVFAKIGENTMLGFANGLDGASRLPIGSIMDQIELMKKYASGTTDLGHRYIVGPGMGFGDGMPMPGRGGMTIIINNYFQRDSVRSYDDIEWISRKQEEMLNLQGVRTWVV